jgi:enoyl-[acyl-carrier-protein] reductase (NADH)
VGVEAAQSTRRHLAKRSMTRANATFDQVASAAAFLASPFAANMTGETLVVDGGFSRSYF